MLQYLQTVLKLPDVDSLAARWEAVSLQVLRLLSEHRRQAIESGAPPSVGLDELRSLVEQVEAWLEDKRAGIAQKKAA